MMPNHPTLHRQFPARPPTLSQRLTALIRAECAQEKISMTALASISGLRYQKVRKTLQDRRPLFLGDLAIITDSLGLDMVEMFVTAGWSGSDGD